MSRSLYHLVTRPNARLWFHANNANEYHSLPATVEEEESQVSSEPVCCSGANLKSVRGHTLGNQQSEYKENWQMSPITTWSTLETIWRHCCFCGWGGLGFLFLSPFLLPHRPSSIFSSCKITHSAWRAVTFQSIRLLSLSLLEMVFAQRSLKQQGGAGRFVFSLVLLQRAKER